MKKEYSIAKFKMALPKFKILEEIKKSNGSNSFRLSKFMGKTQGIIYRQIKFLQKRGLVSKREKLYYITEKGKHILNLYHKFIDFGFELDVLSIELNKVLGEIRKWN